MAVKAEDYSNVCVIVLDGDVTAEAFLKTGVEEFRELLRDYEHQTRQLADLQKTLRVA